MVFGTGAGSTEVEGLEGMIVEWLAGKLVVVVAVNRGAVAVRLTGTGTGPTTTDLIWDCVIIHLPIMLMHPLLLSIHPFYTGYGTLTLCHLIPSALTSSMT